MINLMFDAHDCDGVVYNVHDSDYDCDLKMVQEVGYMWLMLFVLVHQGLRPGRSNQFWSGVSGNDIWEFGNGNGNG